MGEIVAWIIIFLIDIFLAFGPAIMILLSKKAHGKIKMRWFIYCVVSVIFAPFAIVGIVMALTVLFLGHRTDLIFMEAFLVPVLELTSGWFVLYLFNNNCSKIASV